MGVKNANYETGGLTPFIGYVVTSEQLIHTDKTEKSYHTGYVN